MEFLKQPPFRLQTAFTLLLLCAFTACGYNGPKVKYTVALDFQHWVSEQANDPADLQLRQVLAESTRKSQTGSGDPMDAFQQTIRDQGLDASIRVWFLKPGNLPPSATGDEIFQALKDSWNAANDRLAIGLMARFGEFPDYAAQIEIQPQTKQLTVLVNKIDDLRHARNLIQTHAQLGFYATYGIQSIAGKLQEEWQHLQAADTLETLPDLPELIHLEAQRQQNQANMGGRDEAMIGWAMPKDTHQVRVWLDTLQGQGGLPGDLRWAWGAKPMEGQDLPMVGLYALRSVKGKPAINGEVVIDAGVTTNLNGMPTVELSMNEVGAGDWLEMTTANQDRQIAMVVDGAVYSAPYVQEPISVGRTQITGNFSKEEARELAALLKAGNLPGRVRIIGEAEIGEAAK